MGDELISWYELTHTAEMMDGDGRLAAEIWSRQKHWRCCLIIFFFNHFFLSVSSFRLPVDKESSGSALRLRY